MKKHLTYKNEKSDKFWQIEVSGKSFTVTYGKTGTAGASQTKTFDSEEKCLKEAEKLLNEKLRKGYKESEGTTKVAIAPPTPKKKKIDLTKLESGLGVKLPMRLKTFYDTDEYLQYDGMHVFGLSGYSDDSKFKVKFVDPAKSDLLEENDIEMPDDDGAHYIPFSPLGQEPQFLGVDISKGDLCPVAMWEHEDGLFHIHSATLDEFLSRLLKRGEKTPFEQLEKAINKATNLKEKKKYKEALVVLEEASKGMGLSIPKDFEGKDKMARFFNLRGICCGELKNFEEALKNYRLAVDCLDTYSALNIIDYYIDESKDYLKALKEITVLEKLYPDAYCQYHALNYKGYAYVLLGNIEEAKKTYEEILKNYGVKDPDNIEESVKDLEEIIAKKLPNAEIAGEILKEFGQKKYELSPQQIKENREWWNNLDNYGEFWKKKLRDAIKLKTSEPTDNDIARMLEVDTLFFEKDEQINDPQPFTKFSKPRRIDFYGDVESLDVFKNMKSLDRLTYNGKVNKDFKVPSKLPQIFIDAAATGNLEKVKECLQKGIDVNVKVEYGATALEKAIIKDHSELALYLIHNGADIFTRNSWGRTPLDYCNQEDLKAFEKEFHKNGGVKTESKFRIWKEAGGNKACHLDYLKNVKDEYELADGLSRKKDFPQDAFFPMRKDYPGYKKDTLLADCFLAGGLLVANEKVKNFFEENAIKNIEIMPVKINDHNGNFIQEEYFIINPLAQDCLDVEKSGPVYNRIDPESITSVNALVIDEPKIEEGVLIFRIKNYAENIILHKSLAEEISEKGFSGISFKEV